MLGLEMGKEQARSLERIYKRAESAGHEREEVELGLDALAYLILHFAKSKVINVEQFDFLYEACGLKPAFRDTLCDLVMSSIKDIRQLKKTALFRQKFFY